ncbi:MAG: TetR/AcrR family transcriptional regulator [Desulfobacteraceae bacterium]|jgi:AcrR family transcriptional regulator
MGIRERKEREKERRRQQIMVAAKRVFIEKGFGKATMEDIAREAELSAGTLYLYFKNKNELYASLTLRVLQYLFIRLEHLYNDTESDLRGKICNIKNALMDVYEFDPLILRNLFHLQSSEVLKNLSPELVDEIKDIGQKALQKIALIFQQGINKGICSKHHPTAIADIVWALFSGVVLWETSKSFIDQGKDYLKPTLETAFEIFERGIMIQ